jgi:hypothetical protein
MAKMKINPRKVSAQIVVKNLEKQALPIMKKLRALKVKDAESRENARTLTKDLKDIGKAADAKLSDIVEPIKEGIKRIQDFFEPFQTEVAEIEAEVKRQILKYDEKAAAKKKTLDVKFATGKVSASKYLTLSADLEDTKGSRTLQRAIAIDERLTPREYLVPDVKKIEKALKDGVNVKGWELQDKKSIAI